MFQLFLYDQKVTHTQPASLSASPPYISTSLPSHTTLLPPLPPHTASLVNQEDAPQLSHPHSCACPAHIWGSLSQEVCGVVQGGREEARAVPHPPHPPPLHGQGRVCQGSHPEALQVQAEKEGNFEDEEQAD